MEFWRWNGSRLYINIFCSITETKCVTITETGRWSWSRKIIAGHPKHYTANINKFYGCNVQILTSNLVEHVLTARCQRFTSTDKKNLTYFWTLVRIIVVRVELTVSNKVDLNTDIFWYIYISYKMQRYTVYLFLETALHISGCTSTHHQEYIQLYLQHLALVKPWLLPVAIVEELELEPVPTPSR